jgi:hypothetical protein
VPGQQVINAVQDNDKKTCEKAIGSKACHNQDICSETCNNQENGSATYNK